MAYRSGARRERNRRRRRLFGLLMLGLAGIGGLLALAYAAYQTGTYMAELPIAALRRQTAALTRQVQDERAEVARLGAALVAADDAKAAAQRRYAAEVPDPAVADLHAILRQRMAQGVPAARLAQVLRETTDVHGCDGRSVRRRFPIEPPGQTAETVSFLDGLIALSASGDGAKVVTLVSRAWTDAPLRLEGLPAQQELTLNNLSLHLVVEPSGLAGYAQATLSVCGKG